MKIELNNWLPNKTNGNPKFWAIDLLPSIQIQFAGKDDIEIHLGWLFWTLSFSFSLPTIK